MSKAKKILMVSNPVSEEVKEIELQEFLKFKAALKKLDDKKIEFIQFDVFDGITVEHSDGSYIAIDPNNGFSEGQFE